MTRETKIGLLVSLAFVIAVGVLLSDHMVNSTDPKPAPVVAAGRDIAKGLALPDQPNPGLNAPVQPDSTVTPAQTVPSVNEVASPLADPGRNTIEIRPPSGRPIEIANTNSNVPQVQMGVHITPPAELAADPNPGIHQMTLMPGNTIGPVGPVALETTATVPADNKHQSYVAVAGDNVAKMARRFLGADTRANRELIITANDSLKKDPSKVVVGKTYRIPVKEAPAAAIADASTPGTATQLAATEPARASQQPAPAPARTYVVKSGDNLWKIAKGDTRLMEEIRKLNRDALKGQNLKIGMTLRMPAKRAG